MPEIIKRYNTFSKKLSKKDAWVYVNSLPHLKIKNALICCFTACITILLAFNPGKSFSQNGIRREISLDKNWRSVEDDKNKTY